MGIPWGRASGGDGNDEIIGISPAHPSTAFEYNDISTVWLV